MTSQNRVREIKSPQKKSQPAGPLPAEKGPADQAAESPHLLDRSMEAAGGHSPRASTSYLLKEAPLQTAQRQALALQLGRVQGNRALQRLLTNASPHKAGPAPASEGQQPASGSQFNQNKAIPTYPKINRLPAHWSNISQRAGDSSKTETQATAAQATGMSVSLSGIVFYVQEGATLKPGPKGPQVTAIMLQALIGTQYTPGLENAVFRKISKRADLQYLPWATGTAKKEEPLPTGLHVSISAASTLVNLLEHQFKLAVNLSAAQRELLLLGVSVETAWDALHHPQVGPHVGLAFPDWYDDFLFARQLGQHAALIRQFDERLNQFEADPTQETYQEFVTSLRQIGQTLRLEPGYGRPSARIGRSPPALKPNWWR